jgi:hypothetical protein
VPEQELEDVAVPLDRVGARVALAREVIGEEAGQIDGLRMPKVLQAHSTVPELHEMLPCLQNQTTETRGGRSLDAILTSCCGARLQQPAREAQCRTMMESRSNRTASDSTGLPPLLYIITDCS